jgi:phenylacetate-coenzyme A ligase PaaK-like adenylate-forming protein
MNYEQIKQNILAFIENGESDSFESLALQVFTYQYENNPIYRKFCRARKVHPSMLQSYEQIPPVPVGAFKEADISCTPIEEAETYFQTSGTTSGRQGRNIHRDLDVWIASMKAHFEESMMKEKKQVKMAILFPHPKEMPHSSLAHYLFIALRDYGTKDSEYIATNGDYDFEKLVAFIAEAEQSNTPVYLLGATFSFIHFVEYMENNNLRFQLPKGSRVLDTGGSKGRAIEMSSDHFKEMVAEAFALPKSDCVNMYGMTELSSQFYDQSGEGIQKAPHWVKTVVINPENGLRVQKGEKGILVHYDLANFHSVLGVMTEDLGIAENAGFKLLGRSQGAEAKGCSLAVEQFRNGVSRWN